MILQICLMLVQKWQSRSKGLGSSSVALCLKLLNLARWISSLPNMLFHSRQCALWQSHGCV